MTPTIKHNGFSLESKWLPHQVAYLESLFEGKAVCQQRTLLDTQYATDATIEIDRFKPADTGLYHGLITPNDLTIGLRVNHHYWFFSEPNLFTLRWKTCKNKKDSEFPKILQGKCDLHFRYYCREEKLKSILGVDLAVLRRCWVRCVGRYGEFKVPEQDYGETNFPGVQFRKAREGQELLTINPDTFPPNLVVYYAVVMEGTENTIVVKNDMENFIHWRSQWYTMSRDETFLSGLSPYMQTMVRTMPYWYQDEMVGKQQRVLSELLEQFKSHTKNNHKWLRFGGNRALNWAEYKSLQSSL